MIKAAFVVPQPYLNNKIFDLKDNLINRDNCMYPFYLLKEKFKEKKIDLSTYDINTVKESEIVIYNDIPKELPNLKDIKKSVLLIFESELIRPDNWEMEKHKYFHKIFTWKDDIIDNKKYFKFNFAQNIITNINRDLSKKEKLCTLIAGNKRVKHPLELYSKRIEAIRWFEKEYPNDFDLYGMGWDKYSSSNKYINYIINKLNLAKLLASNYPSYRGKVDSKKEVLEKYRFAICYENARDISGYITEKIFDCFFAGCVPIYWGANNIIEHIPKECFIDKRDFKDYETLYNFMTNMSDDTYRNYLDCISHYLNSSKSDEFRADYFANTIVKTVLNDI